MKQMTSETMPDEPILFQSVLESLEPRRLLSAAMPEPVISIAEFSFGASGGSSAAMPMHADYRAFASAPLGAPRIVESFETSIGGREFSVTFFVTPWSVQNSTNNSQTSTQTPSIPTETKRTSTAPSDAKFEASEQITTLSLDKANDSTGALPSVQHNADPAVFATKVVEEVDATPHAAETKRSTETATRASAFEALAQLKRDDEVTEVAATSNAQRPWYQVLDREVIRQQTQAEQAIAPANTLADTAMRRADQADSLRSLALRMSSQQKIAQALRPITASVESTPISIWQRFAMVTLTGGALVANWYVRRRRAKLALHGLERNSVGRYPHLP